MWSTAFRFLQDGLEIATSGDQIWVADGTYRPNLGVSPPPPDPCAVSFALIDGVEIYGGFLGGETALAARDPESNTATLKNLLDTVPNKVCVLLGVVLGEQVQVPLANMLPQKALAVKSSVNRLSV